MASPLLFRQLFDAASSTYTYLLADGGEAVLIDPVFDQARRDEALLRELGVVLLATLETHVHADHVTGAWLLRERCGSRILVGRATGAANADARLEPGDEVRFGNRHLEARATPGHTAGCLTYVLDDRSMAFTGDALLIRGCGRTDFQQGSASVLFHSVREQVLTLPPECLLYPAHDYRGLTVTSVAEERRFNPRLGGDANESDFAGYMANLGLPHPKLMDIAVPANLQCGRPQGATAAADPDWAPVTFTFGGLWEIQPAALAEALVKGGIEVLDVRELQELNDALGHIRGARSLPLSQLAARASELDRDRAWVAVCRSGTRSAQATVLLQKDGFGKVANLAGGMLRWRSEGLPVEGGAP